MAVLAAEQRHRPCPACGTGIPVGWQKNGPKYCSESCKPRCAVEGCEQASRKRTWCGSHYSQWRVCGEVRPFVYKWAERSLCLVCQLSTEGSKRRQFCSLKCERTWRENSGVVPNAIQCAGCGDEVRLDVPSKSGRHRRRIDVKLCRKCKTPHSKKWMSVTQLVARDGNLCRLCGEPVDVTLFAPNPMRASNDHIVPRALGGDPYDPANQQLAHLLCNHIKSDRLNPDPIDPTTSVAYKRYVGRGGDA